MKPHSRIDAVFRRVATFFPTTPITLQGHQPDALCVVSIQPPILALTFPAADAPPEHTFTVSAAGVHLTCSPTENKHVGDHVMLFATVNAIEVDYPFLQNPDALETLVDRWLTGLLPKTAWTHAAHVAVTGYYAFDRDASQVFAGMKQGILHFNQCTGTLNGPDSGYHETLTRFWSDTITRAVHEARPASRFDAALCAARGFGEDRDLPALFYSFNVVRDRAARRGWVAPDLEPDPQ